jgi:hypothetical protein
LKRPPPDGYKAAGVAELGKACKARCALVAPLEGGGMRKENRLKPGLSNFSFAELTPELRTHGCSLHRATFDPLVGPEVFAFFREDPGFAENLGDIEPFTLIAHSGVAKTPFGTIGFIIWQIAAGVSQELFAEQYLNPTQKGALALLSEVAGQTNFKFVAINRETGDISVVVDFANTFGFDRLHAAMCLALENDSCSNFPEATEYVKQRYTVPELVALGALA